MPAVAVIFLPAICITQFSEYTSHLTTSHYYHIYSHLSACEDGTECSETSAYKIHTPGNYPKESIHYYHIIKYGLIIK